MTAVTFATHARAIRSLSPWVPLLAVAILFLGAGIDITSGHAIDPVIFGHGLLALFGLGLLATLIVRGRLRPMGHICFGLAALESACVVAWSWGYVPTTRGLVMASVTIGALYLAGLLFLRMPATPSPESDDAVRESDAWNIARVVSIVAALLAWGGVAAAYAHTGAIPWTLAAWGVAFAALPFVSRSALAPAGALGTSVTAGLLALLLAFASSPAKADPPYGDDFDAAGSFESAVLISPNTLDTPYGGIFENVFGDVDYYRFTVAQGQDISISCTQFPGWDFVSYPCTAKLLDPTGDDQSAGISSDGFSTQISFKEASAGDWRLELSGPDVGYWASGCCQSTTYDFSVALSPQSATGPGDGNTDGAASGGGGALTPMLLLPLALLALRRRIAAVLSLLCALASSPVNADPPYGDDFDAPEFFSDAALISPNTPAGVNRGQYEFFTPDIDYYKFSVSQGQEIRITCTEHPYPYAGTGTGFVQHPCSARLVDPAGLDRSSSISSDGVSTYLSVDDAAAGDWRLEISGADEVYTLCCEKALYFFSVELTPVADGNSSASGAAGSFGYAGSLLLAAAVLLRKRRRLVAAGFLSLLSFAAAAQQDLSDKPIQPGAPIVIHVGPTDDTQFGAATMNFVFEDAEHTYIGTAGHATIALGDRASSPEIGEFGTVVFRAASSPDDFALIEVDADKLDRVSPVVRGFGSAPTGHTTSDQTAQGDRLIMHGWGIGFSTIPETRTRNGVLTDDDAVSWNAVMPISVNDSGSPVVRARDGKALGIVLTVGSGVTVERILALLNDDGFDVTLVTQADQCVAAPSLEDPSDKPIQPGAAKCLHGGATDGTPFGVCTMNFVFKDAEHTYIGSAGHCTLVVGDRETAPGIGEFGTVAFRVSCGVQVLPDSCPYGGFSTDDFALIRVDADKLDMVSAVMRGVGAAPTGFTTSDETARGDLLTTHGWGIPFSTLPQTRTQSGELESDDANSYSSTIIGLTNSGSPVLHASSGKALGIVTTGAPQRSAGPTVERIMVLLADEGFDVNLVTQDSIESREDAKSSGRFGAGALNPLLLLPLALLRLRRARPAHFCIHPLLLIGLLTGLAACGDNSLSAFGFGGSPSDSLASKSFQICPGPNAQTETLVALFEAREGDTIEFCAGRFDFVEGLALHDKRGITLKGAGKDLTVLSFANSDAPGALNVSRMQGFTLQGLTIEDGTELQVWVNNSQFVTIRDVRLQRTGYDTCDTDPTVADGCASHDGNILIVNNAHHLLIEDSEFFGATSSGALIEGGRDVILRRNRAEYNVVGFQLLNLYRALIEDNLLTKNSVGVFYLDAPRARRYGEKTLLRNNRIVGNNTENFAPIGATRGNLARGTGLFVWAADQLEMYGNEIADNDSLGLLLINTGLITPAEADTKYDFFPTSVDLHDNIFRDNGGNVGQPHPRRDQAAGLIRLIVAKNRGKSAHIAWDGAVDAPNDCTEVPLDEDGVPLNQPNPDSPREEGRTDERGRPNFQATDPQPACRWNAWKFGAQGELKPENRLVIQDNQFQSTQPQTMLVDAFVNFHLTTTARPQIAMELLVPATNDLAPHAGRLTALAAPRLQLPLVPRISARPTAEEIVTACNAVQSGQVNWNALAHYNCPLLHQYGLFADPAEPRHDPNGGGVPYDINSALFSDYAVKYRVLFLPPGGHAVYGDYAGDPATAADDSVLRGLQFPVGTVISKTFAFRKEDAAGNPVSENVVETRLLIKRQEADRAVWVGMAYLWKDTPAGRIAELRLEGAHATVEFDYLDKDAEVVDAGGQRRRYTGSTDRYVIPTAVRCADCHGGTAREAGAAPLSPRPRYLNRDYDCPDGMRDNQLRCLDRLGLLEGLPADFAAIEKHPRWNVPGDSGAPANTPADINQRMRAYLEINCAHCHTPDGRASVSGMFLDSFRVMNQQFGICKQSLAAGRFGSTMAGKARVNDIVPGDADASVLHHRDTSNEPFTRMPQLARSIVNAEASALMTEWINNALPALDAADEDAVQNEELCSGALAGTPLAPLPILPPP